jgi:hypothetical protein
MNGLQTAQLPTVPTRKGRAEVVEVEDREAAAQTLRDVLNGPRTTVAVINGTERTGIAREAGDKIDVSTYQLIGVGTSQLPLLTSMIVTDDVHRPAAAMLATQLGIAVIDSKVTPPAADFGKHPATTPAQITVVLGSDFGKTTPPVVQ